MQNATCYLQEPTVADAIADGLERDYAQRGGDPLRCSLRQTNVRTEAVVAGLATVGMWRCRLVSDAAVAAGWQVRAKLDTEDDWHTYRVTRAARNYHLDLFLERLGA